MIPTVTNRSVVIGGSQSSASFGISQGDEAHLMGILREGLYSDKVLAILREYSSNAWDAHRSIGLHDTPISVELPTDVDPTLRIRDYGPGLSHHDVFNVYTMYGRSTKRESNDVVGQLGIGSKSGFAYSDSFTITSWHPEGYDEDFVGPKCGMRRIYSATLGDDEKGSINLLDETACAISETGIEIQIATKPEDHYEFERTARRLFKHMTPRPAINIELPALPDEQTVLTHGTISPGDGAWVAVMGCVPYRVNISSLDERLVNKCLHNLSGTIKFDIGAVSMSASREELKYTAQTKAALIAKFDALVDEFVTHALKQLDAGVFTGWEARLRVQVLAKLELPLPEKWKPFAEGFAKVTYKPEDFTIIHNKSACTRLMVDTDTRLLIDDTGNDLAGYRLCADDYVVRSTNKTPAELRTMLDAALVESGLVGVKIELLSTLYYTAPEVPVKRKSNPKHRARMFQLDADYNGKAPWSENWEAVTRVPTKDDVFVTIEGFKPDGYKEFWADHKSDVALAEAFGVTLPTIYAYKSTEKKPVFITQCEGTHYRAWRETFVKELLTPERLVLIETFWQANPDSSSYYDTQVPSADQLKWMTKELGDNHPIVELYIASSDAAKELREHNTQMIRQLALRNELTYAKSASSAKYVALKKAYPLLRRAGFRSLWYGGYDADGKSARREWADYVQLCDARDAATPNNIVQLKSIP